MPQTVAFISPANAPEEVARWSRRVLSAWPVRPSPVAAAADTGSENRSAEPLAAAVLLTACRSAGEIARAVPMHWRCPIVTVGGAANAQVGIDAPHIRLPESADERAVAAALHACVSLHVQREQMAARCRRLERAADAAASQLQRIDDDLQAGAMLQRTLLPPALPTIHGVDSAVITRPCASLNGDTYDAFDLGEGQYGLLIADACGHGVPAALALMLMSRLLPTVEHHSAGSRVLPPEEALARLNNAFIDRRGDSGLLVTAAYAVIDTRTWTVRCSVAGHPHPVVLTSRGASALDAGGPPLGTIPGVNYEGSGATLEPGDTLVMYTDGLELALENAPAAGNRPLALATDAPNAPASTGVSVEAALRWFVGDEASGDLSSALEGFEQRLMSRHGSLHQRDDLTLMVLRRLRAAGRARLVA